MDVKGMAKELSQLHIDQARLLARLGSSLSASGEAGVLLWLSQQSQDTFAMDIVEHFCLTPGRVANIIKRLEQRGYVKREHVADDRRRVRVSLTDSGRERAEACFDEMNAGHLRMLEALGEKDAAHVMRILRRVIALIDQQVDLHSFEL